MFKFPKSLAEVRTAVRASGSGAAFDLVRRQVASPRQQQGGTRAGAWQGTWSAGNTPDPLHPGKTITPNQPAGWDDFTEMPEQATFSTNAPAYDGTEGTIVQVKDWPANPSREVLSPSIGHHEQLRTDAALQLGRGPGRIDRLMPLRVFGVASAVNGQRGTEDGYNGNTASHDYLQHVKIARQALGTKGPQKLSDDNAVIPAIYAGNPRA